MAENKSMFPSYKDIKADLELTIENLEQQLAKARKDLAELEDAHQKSTQK